MPDCAVLLHFFPFPIAHRLPSEDGIGVNAPEPLRTLATDFCFAKQRTQPTVSTRHRSVSVRAVKNSARVRGRLLASEVQITGRVTVH
jgi:hypothetical protein